MPTDRNVKVIVCNVVIEMFKKKINDEFLRRLDDYNELVLIFDTRWSRPQRNGCDMDKDAPFCTLSVIDGNTQLVVYSIVASQETKEKLIKDSLPQWAKSYLNEYHRLENVAIVKLMLDVKKKIKGEGSNLTFVLDRCNVADKVIRVFQFMF
jgi:hypothetical protein